MELSTRLCELAYLYRSDKTGHYKKNDPTQHCHPYTPTYCDVLKDRNIKNILEIGIGIVDLNNMNHMKKYDYRPGGSLKMWRDYFPTAQVFGIDINKDAVFQEERITTYHCDQLDFQTMDEIFKDIKFDLIIDDGSHIPQHQLLTFNHLRKNHLSHDGIYIIEDLNDKILFYGNVVTDNLTHDEKTEILNNYEIRMYDYSDHIWSYDSAFYTIKPTTR